MNNTTTLEPITKNGQQKQRSYFLIRNEGAYLANFSVSYKLQGQNLSQDSGKFILAESRSIALPKGATDIYLKVELLSFINSWITLFTQSFPKPITKCYRIWGTMLNPQCDEITCLSESSIFEKN